MKSEKTISDEKIIELYFLRDEEAIRRTQEKYGMYLCTLSGYYLANRSDCEECLNDTLFAAWNSIPPARPKNLKAFLATLIRRSSINLFDKNNAKKRANDEYLASVEEFEEILPGSGSVEQALDNLTIRQTLNRWLSTADARKKYIFLGRFYFSKPLETIARELSVSLSTVNKDLYALKNELRFLLEKEGIDL